jgi:hypothetical protein
MPIPKPSYTIWQAISAALALATRALNEVRALARMPGPPGPKGDTGNDGLGFDDMEFDGERRLTFKRFEKQQTIVMPYLIDRGVWKADQEYERGDCVSRDGLWIAQTDNKNVQPGAGTKAWRLAVRRGPAGKDAPLNVDARAKLTTGDLTTQRSMRPWAFGNTVDDATD